MDICLLNKKVSYHPLKFGGMFLGHLVFLFLLIVGHIGFFWDAVGLPNIILSEELRNDFSHFTDPAISAAMTEIGSMVNYFFSKC